MFPPGTTAGVPRSSLYCAGDDRGLPRFPRGRSSEGGGAVGFGWERPARSETFEKFIIFGINCNLKKNTSDLKHQKTIKSFHVISNLECVI